ncbi:hypothetical protein WN51_14476 [Melipona quadrifasciata]|uniref:Uncharacterized protein n=1 Tax=Melipona quadrifasciata TaxID=166423 RepID=A0A0M8ZY08_9HYME|nr:hypothetical protein WN51_14476 [Melipona quadrifasciata]
MSNFNLTELVHLDAIDSATICFILSDNTTRLVNLKEIASWDRVFRLILDTYFNSMSVDENTQNTNYWERVVFYISGARSFKNREEFLVEFEKNISVVPGVTELCSGEESQYDVDGVFECLPCAEGCESCEDDSPCVVSLNWLMRTAILILECCVIACLPAVALFTWKYGNVKFVVVFRCLVKRNKWEETFGPLCSQKKGKIYLDTLN